MASNRNLFVLGSPFYADGFTSSAYLGGGIGIGTPCAMGVEIFCNNSSHFHVVFKMGDNPVSYLYNASYPYYTDDSDVPYILALLHAIRLVCGAGSV